MPIPIRAAILDDERGSIETLQALLARDCPEVDLVATFEYPDVALQELPALAPDLLFLDVEMDDLNGFDVLDALPPDWNGEVVFVTAFPAYAARSYEYAALDYLVKPVKSERLQTAMARFQARRHHYDFPARRKVFFDNRSIDQAEQSIMVEGREFETELQPSGEKEVPSTLLPAGLEWETAQNIEKPGFQKLSALPTDLALVVPTREKYYVIRLEEIVYMKADGAYTWIYLIDGRKIFASKNIGYFSKMLTEEGTLFFRIHESHLVGKRHVTAYKISDREDDWTDGDDKELLAVEPRKAESPMVIELISGQKLPVARRRKAEFKRWIGDLLD